jgi:Spy/CpxP family protein refolding chaperone
LTTWRYFDKETNIEHSNRKERRSKMKKIIFIAAAVSILALAGLAFADMDDPGMEPGMMGNCGMYGNMMGPGMMGGCGMYGDMMGPGMMGGCGMHGSMMGTEHRMMDRLMDLNLDEQQRTSINEIKSKMMKDTIRRSADIRIAQIELKDLLSQDPVDMKAVEAKVKQLETMRTEMRLSHIKAREDIKSKLTPEQRKEFREMLEKRPMMKGMGMMRGHMRGMEGMGMMRGYRGGMDDDE